MRRSLVGLALLLAPAALSAPPSPAQVVKYRQHLMHAAGSHMGAISMIAKGESDRAQDLVSHADALAAVAKATGALYPVGTGPGVAGFETEAKAEIWTQKDKFAAAVKAFETETAKLVEVAKTGDLAAVKTQLGAVGGSCGDCHDAFRVDDH
jgi:cytochrome c556